MEHSGKEHWQALKGILSNSRSIADGVRCITRIEFVVIWLRSLHVLHYNLQFVYYRDKIQKMTEERKEIICLSGLVEAFGFLAP